MFELRQSSVFEASHILYSMPEGHKCRRLHGHRYHVTVAARGTPGDDGIIIDYLMMEAQLNDVLSLLDHRHLNDIGGFEKNPTTENLCKWIWNRMLPSIGDLLYSVSVNETDTATCIYYGHLPR